MIAELMPRVDEIEHDEQTRRLYTRSVAAECTCGMVCNLSMLDYWT